MPREQWKILIRTARGYPEIVKTSTLRDKTMNVPTRNSTQLPQVELLFELLTAITAKSNLIYAIPQLQ